MFYVEDNIRSTQIVVYVRKKGTLDTGRGHKRGHCKDLVNYPSIGYSLALKEMAALQHGGFYCYLHNIISSFLNKLRTKRQ